MREILTLKEVNEFLESFKNNIFDLIICTDNIEQIIQQHQPQQVSLLFKGSRYTHMEHLMDALVEKL